MHRLREANKRSRVNAFTPNSYSHHFFPRMLICYYYYYLLILKRRQLGARSRSARHKNVDIES